ncbi:hypothetical protein BC828DRAFT_383039 [Blastocladiella britannica]|nr:hypothetical protein BC828DRAFT_383039 [Blastocladiella britannica]
MMVGEYPPRGASSVGSAGTPLPQVPMQHTGASAVSATGITPPLGGPGQMMGGGIAALLDDGEQVLTACEPCSGHAMSLAQLRSQKKYVDLRLVLPDNKTDIAAHRVVVAAASEVLGRTLDSSSTASAGSRSGGPAELVLSQFLPPLPVVAPGPSATHLPLGGAGGGQDPVAATNAVALGLIDWMYTRKLVVKGGVAAVATGRAARDLKMNDLVPYIDSLVARYMEGDPVKIMRAAVQYRADDVADAAIKVMVRQTLFRDPKVRVALACLPLARFLDTLRPPRSGPHGDVPGGPLSGLLAADRFHLLCTYMDRKAHALPCLVHGSPAVAPGTFPPAGSGNGTGSSLVDRYCTCDHSRPVDAARVFGEAMDFSALDVHTLKQAASMPNVPKDLIMEAMFAKLGDGGSGGGDQSRHAPPPASQAMYGGYGAPAPYQMPATTGAPLPYMMPGMMMPVPSQATGMQQQQQPGMPGPGAAYPYPQQ